MPRDTAQRLAAAQDQVARLRSQLSEEKRRAANHRKIKLGGLVIASDAADFDPAVIVGCLLKLQNAQSQPNGSEVLESYRQRGLEHLQAREAARK